MFLKILTVCSLFLSVHVAQSSKSLELERNILNSIFNGYDPSTRPFGKNGSGPVVVEINTYIRSINYVDDVKMTYDTQLTFRQSWIDERLKYDTKELDYVTWTRLDQIWIPDLFFSNEESGHFHSIVTPNSLIRIFPNGKVLFSTRISLRLFCPMNLKNYPLDSQLCSIRGASYAYTTDDIVFIWKEKDPIEITKNLHLTKFTLNSFMKNNCTSTTSTGSYSCLKVDLQFTRNVFYYFQRAYMPTAALVILSWIVFWLNPRCSNIRLGIWIGILVSILIVTISVNTTSPEVSYATALDVWMGICVCFIFCVLVELCLVTNALKKEEGMLLQNQLAADESDKNSMRIEDGKRSQVTSYTSLPLKWLNKYSTRAQRIDVISRILFPAAFSFFNFVYWLTYVSRRS